MGKYKSLSIFLMMGIAVSILMGVSFGDTLIQLAFRIGFVSLLEFIVWMFLYGDDE
jgi:hypothetical protein